MKLSDRQRIAARLLAAGVSQKKVAERLEVDPNTVHLWTKKKPFRKEREFWRRKGVEIFEKRMEQFLGLGADRIEDILLEGKDVDALTALDKVIRVTGKYKDKVIIEKQPSEEDSIERLKTIVQDINDTLGIPDTKVGEEDSKTEEGRRPRQLDESNSK